MTDTVVTSEPQAARFQQASSTQASSAHATREQQREQIRESVALPERGEQTDLLLAQRVASGAATPDEVGTYRAQRAARDKAINDARAARAEEFAEKEPEELKQAQREIEKELDALSDEMRSIAPLSPLWKEKRQEKLNLAFALEDIKAGRDQRAYNDRKRDMENRSEQQAQFDAAKNMPLSSEDANTAIDSEVPGKEQPSLEEQNPDLDSRAMLKGEGAGVIRTIQGDAVVAQVPGRASAREAVHGK